MNKKRRKDPEYRLLSTAHWVVSPDAQRVLDRIEKKRARKQAWLAKQNH